MSTGATECEASAAFDFRGSSLPRALDAALCAHVGRLGIEPSQAVYKAAAVKPSGPRPLDWSGTMPYGRTNRTHTLPAIVARIGVEPMIAPYQSAALTTLANGHRVPRGWAEPE
jgi:hypothetical protein